MSSQTRKKKIERQRRTKLEVRRIVVLCFVSLLFGFNINSFVNNGGLIPGGVAGCTLLIQRSVVAFAGIQLPYTVINVALNIIPFYICFRCLGRRFAIYSLLMVMATNFTVDLIPSIHVTDDMLLAAVFGGIINGFVCAICLRQNATTGGTDIISLFLSERKGVDTFNIILGFNACLLLIGGLLFGWDKALYSIIYQYVSTQVIHLLYRRYYKLTLLVVTQYPQEICQVITDKCHHGATILEGKGSYEGTNRAVVYSIVSGTDQTKVVAAIRKKDPASFIDVLRTEEVSGRFVYQPME